VGPEGLEPSPAWVRTRDAAANTSIPFFCFQSARRELNPRPASYKDAALTVELRASESRAGGNRTHSGRLKVCCAAFTPRPHEVGRAYAFQSPSACHRFFSLLFGDSVVALGIELSATRLSAGFGQPALDYLIKVGHPGVEPRPSCSQNRRASICTSARNPQVPRRGIEPLSAD
jgi:hypothetical protein